MTAGSQSCRVKKTAPARASSPTKPKILPPDRRLRVGGRGGGSHLRPGDGSTECAGPDDGGTGRGAVGEGDELGPCGGRGDGGGVLLVRRGRGISGRPGVPSGRGDAVGLLALGVARVRVVQSEDPADPDGPGLACRESAPEPGLSARRIRSDFGARQASQRDVIAALTVSHRAHVQLWPADAAFVVELESAARPAAPTGLRAWQAWHRVSPGGLTVSHSGHSHVSATLVTLSVDVARSRTDGVIASAV